MKSNSKALRTVYKDHQYDTVRYGGTFSRLMIPTCKPVPTYLPTYLPHPNRSSEHLVVYSIELSVECRGAQSRMVPYRGVAILILFILVKPTARFS